MSNELQDIACDLADLHIRLFGFFGVHGLRRRGSAVLFRIRLWRSRIVIPLCRLAEVQNGQ